ncbi:protein-disulfide reductase DsbD domain-containing protein [Parvibaculum sp.]|uniref:protein-disulfide reductase DsbD domain-containing protein n=1 Tax=Parvibaculum sp. TaxID=2024848 RepID=UPI002CA8114C|nr:protein-disulfide reductase DsbD domain-containing protein [Parvibaculum sp.]HUD51979.1 protein-disulfide reductase DsbD domain-containing protein [Parvibaculum sp.]
MAMRARRKWSGAARIAAIFLLFCCAQGLSPLARAGDGESPAQLRLLSATAGHGGAPFLAGIEMRLAAGWHSYWRKPGDSGLAPRFDWSASKNVASVDLKWPVPERFDEADDSTFGYSDEVVWPVVVTPKNGARPVTLVLSMSYGVCSNLCVPGEADLTLAVPAGAPHATADATAIQHYLARVPAAPADPSALSARADGTHLVVHYRAAGEAPQLIVEGPAGLWFGKPEAAREGDVVAFTVPVETSGTATLKGARVVLTLSGPATAIEAVRSVE